MITAPVIAQGWKAFSTLKASKPNGFRQASEDFATEQPAIVRWLRNQDREWFNSEPALFEYGLFVWLIFKHPNRTVPTVADSLFNSVLSEEIRLMDELVGVSGPEQDDFAARAAKLHPEPMLLGFLADQISRRLRCSMETPTPQLKAALHSLSLCVIGLSKAIANSEQAQS